MIKGNQNTNAYLLWLKKYFSPKVLHPRDKMFLLLGVILLLLLSWSGFLSLLDRPLSFLNIVYLHGYFPVWLVNALIVAAPLSLDRKSTRLNSSHVRISY